MNKATRLLAMTGMALAAGLTMGAGPASAATKAPSPARFQGYYHTRMQCEREGHFGELRNRWDDHDCSPVRFGRHHGEWQLEVSWHRGPFGHDHGHGHDNHGGHDSHGGHGHGH